MMGRSQVERCPTWTTAPRDDTFRNILEKTDDPRPTSSQRSKQFLLTFWFRRLGREFGWCLVNCWDIEGSELEFVQAKLFGVIVGAGGEEDRKDALRLVHFPKWAW